MSLSLITLSFYAVLILCTRWAGASDHSSLTVITNTTTPTSNPANTIPFSSAVSLEASIKVQLQQLLTVPAIPMPTNVTDIPNYEVISRLAPALPPVPAGVKLPDSDEILEQLIVSSNGSSTAASLAGRQNTLKVMIIGDSMTQGQQGDWTWRYRMWQWFQKSGIDAEFVGPFKGTVPPHAAQPPQPPPLYGVTTSSEGYKTNGGYAKGVEAAFLSNSNHFAVWGRAAAVSKGLIHSVLTNNQADLILLMLGFNDMGWFYSDAAGTVDSLGTLVSNARAANPNLKFAIANVPQRSYIGGREDLISNTNTFNKLLPSAISRWSTSASPVYLVDLAKTYKCQPDGCPAGYDGLHPNAWGEYQIANAFSQTLTRDFKIGSSALAVPSQGDSSLARSLPVPSNFKVFSSPQGVTATWDPVYGAYNYDIKVSINGGDVTSATVAQFNRWDASYPLDGWTYDVSVRASAGDSIKGQYTSTQSAVAKPQLAPPPADIQVHATNTGLTVTWKPPKGDYTDSITEYNVIYWDWAPDNCEWISGAAFKSSPAVITGLKPGRNYMIALVTWNKNGEGFPFLASNVVPGAGTPSPPTGLKLGVKDAASLRLTWSASAGAGGYRVWSRNVNVSGSKLSVIANVTESTCNEEYFLFPGVWNFAFAVSAFNGNDESRIGSEVIVPSPVSGNEGDSSLACPKQPEWCPGGGDVTIPIGGNTTDPEQPQPTLTAGPVDPTSTDGACYGPDCSNGKCVGTYCFYSYDKEYEDTIDAFAAALGDSGTESTVSQGDVIDLSTRLFGWNKCSDAQKKAIFSGWQQSWKIMDVVKGGINWNEAAAVEYLAPPFVNAGHQAAMKKSLNKVSTVRSGSSLNPFKWWLHVRCDDPYKICLSCDPQGSVSELFAYTTNEDDDSGYARINFCPLYFVTNTLDNIVKANNKPSYPISHRADMTNYVRNQGRVWFHELLHIDWAAAVNATNHIRDLVATFYTKDGATIGKIYGPTYTKGLGRWKYDPGFWIRRNSDSLTMYAMAKYLQKVIGKYPHLPLATEIDDPHYPHVVENDEYKIDENGITTFFHPDELDQCPVTSDQDGATGSNTITFGSSDDFLERSKFPEEYLTQFDGWWADDHPKSNRLRLVVVQLATGPTWEVFQETTADPIGDFCKAKILQQQPAEGDGNNVYYPTAIKSFNGKGISGCVYSGTQDRVGKLTCKGADDIFCYEDPEWGEMKECDGGKYMLGIKCQWS